MSQTRAGASFYAFLSITFWGISFVSTKAVLDKMDPLSLLVVRFGIGSLFLFLLILLLREPWKVRISNLPHLIILGVLGVFIHQVIQASALLTIQASDAGWLIAFSPIFTIFLSFLFLQERITIGKVLGITLSVTGVLMITTWGRGMSLEFSLSIGYILMILSTLNWAVYTILLRALAVPLPPLVLTFYMSMIGFILTLPFFVRNNGIQQLYGLTSADWSHLLFLGIFVSAVAYWYWAKALEVMKASQVSVFLYFEPLATLGAAVLILNERLAPASIAGGCLIVFGVMIVQGRFINGKN
ncbi:UNVERIFIED_CONTAM: DMT family transporter [Halobacillus marinus]|nr:DMT family transporter [Bacillus sp. SB49]